MRYTKILPFIIMFTLFSCSEFNADSAKKNTNKSPSAPIFGWFDGPCFATLESNLKPETSIFVVELGDPQKVSSAEIMGTANVEFCPALAVDRQIQNQSEGLKFYQVKFNSEQSTELAIGIIGKKPKFSNIDGIVLADLGDDGLFARFTLCATSDGISFDIWRSMPYEEEPIWSGYYYLGYDVERNCP